MVQILAKDFLFHPTEMPLMHTVVKSWTQISRKTSWENTWPYIISAEGRKFCNEDPIIYLLFKWGIYVNSDNNQHPLPPIPLPNNIASLHYIVLSPSACSSQTCGQLSSSPFNDKTQKVQETYFSWNLLTKM